MLTIAKLRAGPGSVDYYVKSVASGLEDYYAGKGEAPGQWLGPAAARLGLDGQVAGETLTALMEGRLPGAETSKRSPTGNRTPGWDLTWSAPKSVSVLYGLTDDDTSRQVVAAHDAAVGEAMKYLDRWAVVSRRRIDGEVTGVETQGTLAAAFRHRTSRNMDPQLHTHTLVPNAVERADGTWGAIDSRVFYRHAKTAGYVYQAVLRAELTATLGVEWGAVTKGFAEVTRRAHCGQRSVLVSAQGDRSRTRRPRRVVDQSKPKQRRCEPARPSNRSPAPTSSASRGERKSSTPTSTSRPSDGSSTASTEPWTPCHADNDDS